MSQENKVRVRSQTRVVSSLPPSGWVRWFVYGILACSGLLVLWAFVRYSNRLADVNYFTSQGWGGYAEAIVANKLRALWHAGFMTFCAGGALWVFLLKRDARGSHADRIEEQRAHDPDQGVRSGSRGGRSRDVFAACLLLLVAADAWRLSRHYVATMPMSALDGNPVISLLKNDMPEKRVALVSQDGFYNWWLTYLFPYHGINALNITQMPRMPIEYKSFLGMLGRSPVRLWQLAAVGYVLAPAPVWSQIQREPLWSNAFELVYSYSVTPVDPARIEAGYSVYPATAHEPGQHVVLRLTKPAPRFALIGGYQVATDGEALRLLASPQYGLFQKVLVGNADALGEGWGALTNAGIVGTCRLTSSRPGQFTLEVESRLPSVLRVSEKYDKDWTAKVDGLAVAVHRIDYLFQGVLVPAGRHQVVLKYAPAVRGLYVQFVGMAVCLAAALWLVFSRVKRMCG